MILRVVRTLVLCAACLLCVAVFVGLFSAVGRGDEVFRYLLVSLLRARKAGRSVKPPRVGAAATLLPG